MREGLTEQDAAPSSAFALSSQAGPLSRPTGLSPAKLYT